MSAMAGDSTEQFAERIMGVIDGASTAILVSIGHQTGLFDTLAGLEPAPSAEIARAAGLNERYVREWLGGMVTARVVDYDSTTEHYHLPPDYAAVLTRAAGPDNLARVAQFIPIYGEKEQKIIDCFRDGGGLPYSEYPRFHTLMAEMSGEVFDAALIDVILPLAAGLPEKLRAGADVADFGCGSGHAINVMAQSYPDSRFVGIDISEEGISTGAAEATRLGLVNATFQQADVAALDATEAYDVITAFDSIHDQVQPDQVLANIYRALRPGGVFLMVDIKASSRLEENVGVPLRTYFYTASVMHCMSVSLALGGAGLGTAWGRQLAESMLKEAGFDEVEVAEIESDPVNSYYIARK
ncbi:class I SAM-dependent methyltransferase [Rhodococcus spongiicola]|uniref:Class I SAM-dependent methyltransferase n=1 Tax=Rhodococcus spongiicola TaxID=2487352 RepID=A0A3S3BMB1_9NOCA|nr:class I SAM-dependent methyltransferase [Rhodococcus spongiicola]RVW04626.1 class I SAM-dependent methyltransferase [Rhodococcus spongiicola]